MPLSHDDAAAFASLDKPALPRGTPSNIDSILKAEGAAHLKPVFEAIYGQESGSGANPVTSKDGARGGMQVIPATFKRLAREGESIDNPDDNMRVGVRYIKQLGDRFGNDPARIATGYFSGEGNVNPAGDTPYKVDRADGNRKTVSSYVRDVMGRIGNTIIPSAQAKEVDGLSLAREIAGSDDKDPGIALAREIAGMGSEADTPLPKPKKPSLVDDLKKAVRWREGESFKVPEGQTATDATFSAGVPTEEEQLTPMQRMQNKEIDRGRRLVEGLEPEEIKHRAAGDKTFAAYARLAGKRKTGPDDWHDQPPAPKDDQIQRFASDKAMAGNTLGKRTDKGIEVLDGHGKLIGHWE